jgi:hypothetical protein
LAATAARQKPARSLRAEPIVHSEHWLMSLDDATENASLGADYDKERPHSAITNKTLIDLIKRSTTPNG